VTEQTIRGLAASRLRAAAHFITALLAGLVGLYGRCSVAASCSPNTGWPMPSEPCTGSR